MTAPHGRGRAWIELDREALAWNVTALTELLPPDCRLMPAMKANAYGHGATLIAPELERLGVTDFCVATVGEGAELRQAGIRGEILVLGYTGLEDLHLLEEYGLIQTVVDAAHAALLERAGRPLRVQLKLDTGMHRLGERSEHLDAIAAVFRCRNLRVEGIYTHLCADNPGAGAGRAVANAQAKAFYATAEALERRGCACGKKHLLASAGLLCRRELGGDYVRVGLALYGLGGEGLRPVLSLLARVAVVKPLYAGETAGYGPEYRTEKDRRIAVVTVGYADGLPRTLSHGRGAVLLHGKRAPILGLVCMDQILVDVTDIPQTAPGDIAVLIGRSGSLSLSAVDLAAQAGTIPNEILSRLGQRLPRMLAAPADGGENAF